MIALTVIGILTLVAIPSLTTLIKNQRIIGVSENLYSVLQNARSEAIKRNNNVYVSFQIGSNWCYGVNSGSACDCSTPTNCNLGTVTASNTQITLSQSGLSGTPLQFYFESSHGGANAQRTFTFTDTNGTTAMTVKVNVLGNLSICSSQLTGYTACT